jgi:hypothetical protein
MPIILEQFRTFTVLGIRFWDAAREAQITDGLRVAIRPMSNPTQAPVLAFQTASGAYAFQRLPGLRSWENGEQAANSPLTEIAFVVAVTDTRLRYLPAVFRVDLPLPYLGLYRPGGEAASPLEDMAATHFYLFSAPSRTPPSGMAVIRAQLYDGDNGHPAAFALVEVSSATESWFGLAAENGSTAVIFPYPTFSKSLGGESPLSLASEQQWPLTVRIYYQPEVLEFLLDYQVPDLHSIRRQGQAPLFPIVGGPAEDEQQIQLFFEQETVLASDGLSHLLIAPAPASP